MNISDIGINQILNEAVWTTSSQKMILQATTGKTIKGVIPKVSWDQMLSDETIIIRATLLNRVLEISIGKESNITLKSLSITPLSVLFSTNDCKSFTLSGTMSDGSPAPLEILSKAIWRVGSVTNFRLLEKVGSSVSVETVEITGPGDTYFSPRNRNEETINAIGGIGDTTLVTSILSATIGDISATATLKRYSSTSGGGTRPPRPGEGGEFSLEDGKEGINLDTSVEITTPAGLTIGDLANTDKEESLLNFDEVNTIQTNLQSATLIADIPVAATTYYIYDNNNNLIETRNGTIGGTVIASYEYNEFNQLVKLANQSGLTSYTYNPSGLRTSKTLGDSTTNYYYDGDNVIIETINGNFTARNIMGINPIARETNTSKLYYLYNGHADVIAMVDASGTVINSYSYDIYGNIISANEADGANPIRYAGQYYDNESDMYYLRARYYDPGLMRFITEDSYKGDVKDPLSLNLYSYCVGNPIELFDNEGHAPSRIDNEFGASESSFWQRIQGGLDNTKPIGNFEIPTSGEILANLLSSAFGNIRLVTKTVDTSLGKNGELILWPKKYETSKFPKAGRILSKTGTVLTLVSNLLDIANTWTEDNGNTVSKRMVKTGVQIGGAVVAYNLGSLNARLAGGLVLGEAPSAGLTTIGLVVVVGLDVVEGIVISWVQDKIYEIVDIH